MSHKERMLHMVFEIVALVLMAVAATYIVGGGAVNGRLSAVFVADCNDMELRLQLRLRQDLRS